MCSTGRKRFLAYLNDALSNADVVYDYVRLVWRYVKMKISFRNLVVFTFNNYFASYMLLNWRNSVRDKAYVWYPCNESQYPLHKKSCVPLLFARKCSHLFIDIVGRWSELNRTQTELGNKPWSKLYCSLWLKGCGIGSRVNDGDVCGVNEN